ncbi:MAG: SDR family oxidoreductase [Lacipirellulaceae bacterium]
MDAKFSNQTEGNTALVTGASGGLGKLFAEIHAARGGNLVLVARSEGKLAELQSELQEKHKVHVTILPRDLSTPTAGEELAEEIRGQGIQIDYLINNAGFGGHGPFIEREWQQDRSMILLNVLALTALTRELAPAMVERGHGKILNVASAAAFIPGPLQAVYYATKAYVLSFSEALANELADTGVTVTALCPGATKTGFADRADAGATQAFSSAASADDVAKYGYEAMLSGKTVAVHGLQNKILLHGLIRFLPRWLITKISRSTMEKG